MSLSMMRAAVCACALTVLPWGQSAHAATETLPTTGTQFKTSFESVKLPGNEKMGFLGGQFLYDINPWLSFGPATYGALTGQRGGFITLGLAADAKYPINDDFEVNGGYFVGAGGGRGGYLLSGGGLMLRAHLGVNWLAGKWGKFGLGISNVNFPNGSINSTQPYISYSYPFETLLANGWLEDTRNNDYAMYPIQPSEQEFSVVTRAYKIPNGVLTDAGAAQHKSMQLVGAEWLRYLKNDFFLRLESEGAMGGKSNGYMQIFLGGGYRFQMGQSTALKFSLSAGVAGGGAVATGGGLLLDGQASLQQHLTDDVFIEGGVGYVKAPQSHFKAISFAGKLGYHYGTPDVQGDEVSLAALSSYNIQHFRFRMVHQSYLKADPQWRSHHANLNVDNLGVQVDYFLGEHLYLSGQGIAAYKGKAGAYMAGLVGAGVHQTLFGSPFFVDAEALVGAAGGGGMDVGGGLVWQANTGLGYQINDNLSVQAGYGRMESMKGRFKANVVSLSLAYHFSLFTL